MPAHPLPRLLLVLLLAGCGDSDGPGDAGDQGSAGEGAADGADAGATDLGARPRPAAGQDDADDDDEGDAASDAGTGDGALPLPCDVAGVLEGNCIRCHGARPQQGAPMSLLSWQDLTANAGNSDRPIYELVIERVLSTDRPMPPEPNPGLGPAQIDAIERWAAAGAEPGDDDACLLPR